MDLMKVGCDLNFEPKIGCEGSKRCQEVFSPILCVRTEKCVQLASYAIQSKVYTLNQSIYGFCKHIPLTERRHRRMHGQDTRTEMTSWWVVWSGYTDMVHGQATRTDGDAYTDGYTDGYTNGIHEQDTRTNTRTRYTCTVTDNGQHTRIFNIDNNFQ